MSTARELNIDIGGTNYQIESDDNYLDHIKNGFEPESVRLFRSLASGSEVILDIGANIGCTAILFGGLAKTVHSFEPSASTFAFLQKNVSRAGLKHVVPHNFGLGAEPGEFTLSFSAANRSGGFVSNQVQASAGHKVETITIRTLDEVAASLKLPRVDFIKIDVEGFEGHVLKGGKQTLAKFRPVVCAELNHWCLNAFQRTSVPDFLDQLRAIFPILVAVDGAGYMNLHDPNDSYIVMYHHILNMRFLNVVGAFDENRLAAFRSAYRHGFTP